LKSGSKWAAAPVNHAQEAIEIIVIIPRLIAILALDTLSPVPRCLHTRSSSLSGAACASGEFAGGAACKISGLSK